MTRTRIVIALAATALAAAMSAGPVGILAGPSDTGWGGPAPAPVAAAQSTSSPTGTVLAGDTGWG
ncbi:hypothetical protein P3T35_001927 [Kitasatospora sp. GP30]|uniref:hypothetical protein n=1 Tax=Kitasatospora sp. GP30 TaxID=3035084 RepID=UPI000C70A200|nr:hypothetical protein [Kitasatospora sp. GP30]MDH6139927.1 hypothetical protein [Kitasatospora sp. GP30]